MKCAIQPDKLPRAELGGKPCNDLKSNFDSRSKPTILDLRHETNGKEIGKSRTSDPVEIRISHGTQFTLKEWTLLFESAEACRLWCQGVHNLMLDTRDRFISSHTARIERFIAKHFYNLVTPGTELCAEHIMKHLLQIHLFMLFASRFAELAPDGNIVKFESFMKFLENMQSDSLSSNRSRVVDFLRRYFLYSNFSFRFWSQHLIFWIPECGRHANR
ncbi:hypothetical protein COOONC_25825 [Cooperia oncophora]